MFEKILKVSFEPLSEELEITYKDIKGKHLVTYTEVLLTLGSRKGGNLYHLLSEYSKQNFGKSIGDYLSDCRADWNETLKANQTEEVEKETSTVQTSENYIAAFDIELKHLLRELRNNAYYGGGATVWERTVGDNTVKVEGFIYEPVYEMFSASNAIYLNDELLFKLDARNVASYRNEEYVSGRFETENEAIKYIQSVFA